MRKSFFAVSLIFAGIASSSSAFAAEDVLVGDGTVRVTNIEFASAIEYLVPQAQQDNMRSKEKNLRGFLADYLTVKMMADAARGKGLDKDVSVQIQQDYYHNRLLTEALVNDFYANAKQPDYEVLAKESYLSDLKRFDAPPQVRAEHILISVKDKKDDSAALKKAQELYERVTKGKENFADLAKKYSDDPSAAGNSGDLGYFAHGAMVKPFADAAFAMKKGEISKPVKTNFGYHIIHVLDNKKAGTQSFDEVKAQLIEEQKKVFKDAKRDEIVSKFRSSPDIKVDEDALKEFVKKMQQ